MSNKPHVHFIAIGGSIMHSLAINLHLRGYTITGSDDEIFEPSRGNLQRYGLLPPEPGWFPEKMQMHPDAVILGMHARSDNPELEEARHLGIPVFSFPEYFYQQTKTVRRIVIAGSYGKTTITAMVMHALRMSGIPFSYLIGSHVPGFDHQVWIDPEAQLAVMEGDEYLSSPLDPRPKFLHYRPHIALISGIAWDHMNVFPQFESYVNAFADLIRNIEPAGTLVFFAQDETLKKIIPSLRNDLKKIPYNTLPYTISNGKTRITLPSFKVETELFGNHMMQNMAGAMYVTIEAGLSQERFLLSMQSFRGAEKRLQKISDCHTFTAYLDFAHAPSKVKASVSAVKEYHAGKKIIACLELHTFSSLNKSFISSYRGSLDEADFPIVYFNPITVIHKKLPELTPDDIFKAFHCSRLNVFTDRVLLEKHLYMLADYEVVLLLMSSGHFGGLNIKSLIQMITNKLKAS